MFQVVHVEQIEHNGTRELIQQAMRGIQVWATNRHWVPELDGPVKQTGAELVAEVVNGLVRVARYHTVVDGKGNKYIKDEDYKSLTLWRG